METTPTRAPEQTEQFKITGDWKIQSKTLKEKFTQLTDEDLKFEAGEESELFQRMEKRLNMKRTEVIDLIKKANENKN